MKGLFIILCIILSISCNDQFNVEEDCLTNKLEDLGMIKYSNQSIDCEFYVELWIFNSIQYYHVDSHCADVEANLQDCYGYQVCVEEESALCTEIYQNAEKIGIVGIAE